MKTSIAIVISVSAALTLVPVTAAELRGQQQQGEEAAQLVFEREVFTYPAGERGNPFKPLVGLEGGPRFEDLTLLGIVHSPARGQSIALFGASVGGGGQGEEGPGTYRVRQGERLGNTTILEIHPERVVVEVEEFGVFEQHVLELEKETSGEGASS